MVDLHLDDCEARGRKPTGQPREIARLPRPGQALRADVHAIIVANDHCDADLVRQGLKPLHQTSRTGEIQLGLDPRLRQTRPESDNQLCQRFLRPSC